MFTECLLKAREKRINKVLDFMLKRAHLTREKVCEVAIRSWATKNLDLLTPKELEEYRDIIRI
jgi:hypothetical protein